MPKILTDAEIAQFERDGFVFPIRVMPAADAARYHAALETYEAASGGPIQANMRHKMNLLFTWANQLVRLPRILDAVEDLIGPDIICWTTNFFIKEARDPAFVSWHQDSTYWGLEPCEVVTAWVALTDAPVASGAMKFLPESHQLDQIRHTDTFDEQNLLTRGQEVDMAVDETLAVDVPLAAGEISLHHIRLVHGSKPNTTDQRRVGLAIRYVPPHVRQIKLRDSAMLVRGRDDYGHFDWEPEPIADLDAGARAAHRNAVDRNIRALYSGTDKTEMRK